MKTIALFLTLLIPTLVLAEVEPLSTPSPNVGTITPTAIVAETASFSGSVTVSSVTVKGGGAQVWDNAGYGDSTRGLRIVTGATAPTGSNGLNIWDDGGTNRFMTFGDGSGYSWVLGRASDAGATKYLVYKDNAGLGIGTASPATTLDVNGNAQFGSGANKSTFTATGGLEVPYGVKASTFQAGAVGYGLNANPGTTQGLASSGGHTLLRANTGSTVYVQNAAGTTFASFDATNTTLNNNVVMSATSSPASGAACTAGTITWDASYIYVCTASGAWKRSALTGGY